MLRNPSRLTEKSTLGDLESRASIEEHVDLRVWLRLMTIHKLVRNEISRCLRDRFSATLPRFDLMSQLRRNPKGMRMVELSRRLMVTNGNITAITDQLEKEGLVQRTVDPHNRSAFLIKATTQGRRAFDAMAKEHQQWLVRLFGGLTDKEKHTLLELLGKHKTYLAQSLDHLQR